MPAPRAGEPHREVALWERCSLHVPVHVESRMQLLSLGLSSSSPSVLCGVLGGGAGGGPLPGGRGQPGESGTHRVLVP